MKRSLIVALALLSAAGCASTGIADGDFGLRRASVFEQTTPQPFDFDSGTAGKGLIAPLPGAGTPPMISHAIDDMLPLTAGNNGCRVCHDKPGALGKPVARGQPAPAPASHYVRDAGQPRLAGKTYLCTACHAPQAGVAPLVANGAR